MGSNHKNSVEVRDSGHVPPGMDCLQLQLQPHQLRTQPFHYLINEQAKSLLALQELQNEVGALLEFRDLVMETFPNLRQKMSSSSSHTFSNNQNYISNLPMPLSGSLNSRHWEPGIKVKRKIINKSENESSFGRVRSNSHSSKIQSTQPKSSEAISGVQDSGFSTETNSSNKDHASSTATSVPLPVQFDDPFSRRKETGIPHKDSRRSEYERSDEESSEDGLVMKVNEAEEELWNLLDVIHTKGTKLREEVETLQLRLVVEEIENHLREKELEIKKVGRRFNRRCRSLDNIGDSGSCLSLTLTETDGFQPHFKCHDLSFERDDVFTKKRTRSIELEDVDHIREERNMLLDKLAEMETENVANRIKTSELQNEISALISTKEELQEQLLQAVKQKNELNSRIHELHLKFVTGDRKMGKSGSRTDKSSSKDLTDSESSQSEVSSLNRLKSSGDDIDVGKIIDGGGGGGGRSSNDEKMDSIDLEKFRRSNSNRKLGALDGILSNPKRFKKYCKLTEHSRKKLEAILKEKNYLELQRHLLIFVVENQTLNHELESSIKSRENLCEQLDKFRKENDELLFRLEEKSIELEGTRAQVRVLEKLQNQSKSSFESRPHPSETSKTGENFTFLENDHLRSKGFSESEINRARQIFLESQNRKVDKSEIMKLLNRTRHSSQTSSSTEIGSGFDLGKTSNVIPILALPLPAMSSHQSSETESTQALEISSELEADMARVDNKNDSLKNEKSPYRRRPSKIPLNIQKNSKSLASCKSLKTALNGSSPSLKKSDGELSKSKDFNTSLKKCSLDNSQNSITCRSPSSQNPNSIKYSSVGRTNSQLSIASQRSHTPSRLDKRKSLTNSGKEENSLTTSTRNLSLKQTTNFSNIRQRDTLTRKNQNDNTDNVSGGGGGGGGVGNGGGGKRTFRSSFRESFRNRISIDGNSMSSRKEVSMSSSARKDSIQSKSNRSNPVQGKTNTNKTILTSDSDTTKFEGSSDDVTPTRTDELPSGNILRVSSQQQPQDSEIFLDSLNSSAKPRSNLLKEVRENFHKKLTEKVSATLSGYKLTGTERGNPNVWNIPKSEDDYVSEEVGMGTGERVDGLTNFEMNYFDSIDDDDGNTREDAESKDDSLLINSCYYLNNNVENEAMAELDSLEIKLSHVVD